MGPSIKGQEISATVDYEVIGSNIVNIDQPAAGNRALEYFFRDK